MEDLLKSISHGNLELDDDKLKNLETILDILAQYSWIYTVRNIDIFVHNVLEKIPLEWVEALYDLHSEELWKLPYNHIKEEWPSSLKLFINQCNKIANFRFPEEKFQNTLKEKTTCSLKKTTDKKMNEVEIMSHLVHEVSTAVNCNVVLDIGSGLGYLNQALHYNFKICSIALDSVRRYTLAAQERLKKDNCKYSIIHETIEVKNSENCLLNIESILARRKKLFCICDSNISESNANHSPVVMVGLHSCGNLAQDMMKLFCKLKEITAFICISCCYNKINLSEFPMSKVALSALKTTQESHHTWKPCIPGLRLAAHGTRPVSFSVSSEEKSVKYLIYRAILEYFIKKENIKWQQPERHVRPASLTDFPTYCSRMFAKHKLNGNVKTLKKLSEIYELKKPLFPRVRILLVLQTLLQPLWEMFVIFDRVLYFKENNIFAEVIALWDEHLSCRNLALCAYKS